MPSSLWKDIKKTVKDGISVAADKTEEYTKIGKIKVEILNINRNIDKAHTNLGIEIYSLMKSKSPGDISKNAKALKLVGEIDKLKTSLKAKEKEIKEVKKESAVENKTKESPTPSKAKTTGAKKTGTKSTKK